MVTGEISDGWGGEKPDRSWPELLSDDTAQVGLSASTPVVDAESGIEVTKPKCRRHRGPTRPISRLTMKQIRSAPAIRPATGGTKKDGKPKAKGGIVRNLLADGNGLFTQPDGEGLGSGLFKFQIRKRRFEMGLGSLKKFTLEQFREEVHQGLIAIRAGRNPLAEKPKRDAALMPARRKAPTAKPSSGAARSTPGRKHPAGKVSSIIGSGLHQ